MFVAPDATFQLFDNGPIKVYLTILILLLLATIGFLARALQTQPTALRNAQRAFHAALAFATSTVPRAAFPIDRIVASRLGVPPQEVHQADLQFILIAWVALLIFLGAYVFVAWLEDRYGVF